MADLKELTPSNMEEAMNLVYEILNQGDPRYNRTPDEIFLASCLLEGAISLEEIKIPQIEAPNPQEFYHFGYVQKEEKYIAKILLQERGFSEKEIFFERYLLGSKPDVLAEGKEGIIPVECCSCRIDKIADYLKSVEEVWVIIRGEPPWQKPIFNQPAKCFKFKKGKKWQAVKEYQKKQLEELKKIPSPIDNLMNPTQEED